MNLQRCFISAGGLPLRKELRRLGLALACVR
jgi:hypothetical protein